MYDKIVIGLINYHHWRDAMERQFNIFIQALPKADVTAKVLGLTLSSRYYVEIATYDWLKEPKEFSSILVSQRSPDLIAIIGANINDQAYQNELNRFGVPVLYWSSRLTPINPSQVDWLIVPHIIMYGFGTSVQCAVDNVKKLLS